MKSPLGHIEPHAPLLEMPSNYQLLYKMMTAENLLRSIDGKYLHFNRIDSYKDFPGADLCDGKQTPKDYQMSERITFEKTPDFSAADYYHQSRSRTYACCFSLENSELIWNNYAKNSSIGKMCIVFNFGRLRECLNKTLRSDNTAIIYNGNHCRQIFSLNYGIVQYDDWKNHQLIKDHLPNPILYTYLKDTQYSDENELRISLSAPGFGHFFLSDGRAIEFPDSFQFHFDFKEALSVGIIKQLLCEPDCNFKNLKEGLVKLGIEALQK